MGLDQIGRILVPIDFSPCSEAAIDQAMTIAERFGATVDLLHVWRPGPFTFGVDSPPTSLSAIAFTDIGERMKVYLGRVESRRLRVRARLETGNVGRTIVDLVSRDGYDLIVMGTHGRTGVAHRLLGGVTDHVVRRAPCPVVTVRAPPEAATASISRPDDLSEPPPPFMP